MKNPASRRSFLTAGLAAPAIAYASATPLPPTTKLTYRTLGKTGLRVTTLGFGCMITSDGTVIERAADIGVNYFDTARGYQNGNCERMVGAALKSRRKRVFISTKSGADTKAGLLSDLDTSLRELQTDYIDIFYLHGKDSPDAIKDELIEAQQIAKQAGKIRFAGMSCHPGHPQLFDTILAKKHFDVVLTVYNFATAANLDASVTRLANAGIGVVAMKVMAGGSRAKGADVKERLARPGAMLAAIKFVLKNPAIPTCIPSMTDNDQLDENLRAMSEAYADPDAKILAERLDQIRPLYCRYCGSCTGTCDKGLPVSAMLRYLTYADGYGEFALGREHFRTLPEDLAAIRCGDCTECTVHCPNGVRVAERLSRAQELFA